MPNFIQIQKKTICGWIDLHMDRHQILGCHPWKLFENISANLCNLVHSGVKSSSPECLRFGHWLRLCTLNIHLLSYLLTHLLTFKQILANYLDINGNQCNRKHTSWVFNLSLGNQFDDIRS